MCTSSHGIWITLTSRHSASALLRITRVASARPASVSASCLSPATCSRPSRSIRATVWLTVGPDWARRSAIRARSGTIPSSSSSNTVRRYISVVSISPWAVTEFSSSLPALRDRRPGQQQVDPAAQLGQQDAGSRLLLGRACLGYLADRQLDIAQRAAQRQRALVGGAGARLPRRRRARLLRLQRGGLGGQHEFAAA